MNGCAQPLGLYLRQLCAGPPARPFAAARTRARQVCAGLW